jgi:hypothetical protein
MPPTLLISIWLVIGLPSFVAGVVLTIGAIYGRRLLRLRRRRRLVRHSAQLPDLTS